MCAWVHKTKFYSYILTSDFTETIVLVKRFNIEQQSSMGYFYLRINFIAFCGPGLEAGVKKWCSSDLIPAEEMKKLRVVQKKEELLKKVYPPFRLLLLVKILRAIR